MFDSSDFPKSLDEDLFDQWMEEGRNSKIANYYLLIIWDEMDEDYTCEYVSHRQALQKYQKYPSGSGRELLVAAYDLYSESRIE